MSKWIKMGDRRPEVNGSYVICMSTPYSRDDMSIGTQYFHNGYFEREVSGANYIAFWLDELELPELSFDERNKLVILPTEEV